MSEITTQETAAKPLTAATAAFKPQDNIFRSFNALNPKVSEDLLGNLQTVIRGDISDYITVSEDGRKFSSSYLEQSSSFESLQEFSMSIGLSGNYGVYSASASRETNKVEASAFTAVYSTYRAELLMGTISLNALSVAEKLSLLPPEMVDKLQSISSLADARDFTNNWGTHLVTRVNTGGSVFVSNSVETASHEMRETVADEIKASYKKVASIDVAISVSNDIKTARKEIMQEMVVLGGDPHKAAAINPADKATIMAWATSVNADTTLVVVDSIEIFSLAEGTARTMLKKYIDLTMLAYSLEHPVIFSQGRDMHPQATSVTVIPQKGFKVIGGGAAATLYSNNFLIGSYPQSTDGRAPAAWLAATHDLMLPPVASDVLTGYAIAIHDPEDYIEVMVAQGRGSKIGMGGDKAEATLTKDWIMTCGGVFSDTISGFNKFVMASYFKDAQTWAVANSDYKNAATNVVLHAFAVGIKSNDPLLTIEADMQKGSIETGQHGHPTVGGKGFVCGGGVNVEVSQGPGNLVQKCWPSERKIWKAANKDLDSSVSQARSQAFAISLHASIEI